MVCSIFAFHVLINMDTVQCTQYILNMAALVAWHSGRTVVFDRRTFPVPPSTCSWRVTTYVDKASTIRSANSAFHPFEIDRWVISWSRCPLPWSGCAIWWMLTNWMQVGSFDSWINVWVAGKTVWSLINTCHSWGIVAPLVTLGVSVG